MITFFNRISAILTDIAYIISPEYKIPKRGRLLLDYLRMRIKVTFGRFIKYKSEHFLGYTVAFANYSLFFEIFRQVFVRQAYYMYVGKQDPAIIDCGGNMGMSVMYFKYLYPKGKIMVFEPSPTILPILKQNLKKNNLSDVTLMEYAVSAKEGDIVIYDKGMGSCGSTLVEEVFDAQKESAETKEAKKSTIHAKKLSTFIGEKVDILKMDIEGVEEEVLRELLEAGKLQLVQNLSLEYHWYKNSPGNDLGRVIDILSKAGHDYQVYLEEVVPGADLAMTTNGIYYCMLRSKKR